jgi:MFS family permease
MNDTGIAPNAKRLLWAGFLAIFAAGIGLAIRGGLFAEWLRTFNFTALQVGLINGAGFTGFCFGIIIGGIIVDKVGYGKLVVVAFLLHIVSAVVTFGASAPETGTITAAQTQTAFVFLWAGTFLFAVANGTLEAVANPLVATLFPNNRMHYLNILHASWPAGLVFGALVSTSLPALSWKVKLSVFLVPTVIYGIMFMGQHFPKSEASQKGLSLGEMFKDVGIIGSLVIGFFVGFFVKDGLGPLLQGFTGNEFFGGNSQPWKYISIGVGVLVWLGFSGLSGWSMGAGLLFMLFIVHALVGAVELGTDSWIQNITGNILTPQQGQILFIFTSALMLALRFCGHFIEKNLKLSPVGLLFICALCAVAGLNMVSAISTFGGAMAALVIYGIGKTFFWPTMLAVTSDRFPRTGAVAISIMGGIGMMSAGLIGSPGLGYAKDRFAGADLEASNPALYAEAKAARPSQWLVFKEVHGIDGAKLGAAQTSTSKTPEQAALLKANENGDRKTLKADSVIPIVMAAIYLGMILYFKSIGGYKPVHIVPVAQTEKRAEASAV